MDQMFLALDHVDQCGSHDDQHALRVSTRCHQHTCISRTEERQRERAAAGSSLARPSRRLGHNKAQLKSVCVKECVCVSGALALLTHRQEDTHGEVGAALKQSDLDLTESPRLTLQPAQRHNSQPML